MRAIGEKGGIRNTRQDKVFLLLNFTILGLVFLTVVYPLVYIVSSSFSQAEAVMTGRVWLLPVQPSLEGYLAVFAYSDVWRGYANTILYTIAGTSLNVILTLLVAYPLSRKDFVGRNAIMVLFTLTMFFSGGLIPTYLLVRNLGLVDTRWAMILPNALVVWNVIITRTYLQSSIPGELYDSGRVDGASNVRMFASIVIPLSAPIIAVITLFYAVGHWNSYFPALIYLRRSMLQPLQIVLREILVMNSSSAIDQMMQNMTPEEMVALARQEYIQALLQYALIVVATAPVIAVFPFVQKYFVRGIMIGAIKG